jgi:Subtilase family
VLRPVASLRRRTLAGALAALLAAPAVAVGTASAAQADAVRQQELWVLNAINVAGAWQHTHGSGVTVALIDSGVNGDVSDLAGAVETGRDFSGVNTPETDANWGIHGTWMASLIVGHGHASGGSSGIMGVAPDAKLLSIRAVTDQGDPGYQKYQHEPESRVQGHLAQAIRYATNKNVSVISMSLGYQGPSRPVREAISAALRQGIVVVASSGNSGGSSSARHGNAPYSFPADYPGVLGVGAVAQTGLPAGFSSANLSVQVAAPGVRVPAQGRDGHYWLVSGTSPACALTAGVAALIKSAHPTLAPSLVVQAITASTSNKPHGGYDEEVGFGSVDATAALRMAGRLARDRATGHGLVATAQFGGGTAAIPAVPVTPRGKSQLVTDSVVALLCLAIVLLIAFRLIATRRAGAAAAPARPGPPGAGIPGPAWTGPGPAEYGTPADRRPAVGYPEQPGYGAPNAYAPPNSSGAPVGYQPLAADRPDASYSPRPPSGTVSGYGPPSNKPDGQTSPSSYGPLAEHSPPEGRGSPDGHSRPDAPGSLDGEAAPGGRGSLTSDGSPDGYGTPDSPGSLDGHGLPGALGSLDGQGSPDGAQPPAADRRNAGGPSADYGSPAGFGPTARFGPQTGDQPPASYRRPDMTQAPGSLPDRASTAPLPAYQPQEPSASPVGPAEDPSAADDDPWPPSGQW